MTQPAPYMISGRRRNSRIIDQPLPQSSPQMYIEYNNYDYDYEDAGNSSCGEDDNHFLNRPINRHNRRLFKKLHSNNQHHLDSNQIIPRQNSRLRSLFERVNQEIEKNRSECFKPFFL